MGMRDVVDLYNRVGEGAEVKVIRESLLHIQVERDYARKRAGGADHLGFAFSD
jgi:hypothetical protein